VVSHGVDGEDLAETWKVYGSWTSVALPSSNQMQKLAVLVAQASAHKIWDSSLHFLPLQPRGRTHTCRSVTVRGAWCGGEGRDRVSSRRVQACFRDKKARNKT